MINPLVVFTPKVPTEYKYKRFFISYNRLEYYVGTKNANTARLRRDKSKTDKTTVKFRKYGKLEFYER